MISRSMLSVRRPPGLRQETGNLPVDLAPAVGLERVGQTAREFPDLRADALCDWRRAIAAGTEISAVRHNDRHQTNLFIDYGSI